MNVNSFLNRVNQDFRAQAIALKSEIGLTEEEIADAHQCDRTMVNHWFSYGGNTNYPAANLVAMEGTIKLLTFRFELLKYLASGSPIKVSMNECDTLKVNGSVDDEIAGIVEKMGALRNTIALSPEKKVAVGKLLEEIRALVSCLETEVYNRTVNA